MSLFSVTPPTPEPTPVVTKTTTAAPPRLYADMYYALWDVGHAQFLCDETTRIPYLFVDYDRAVWLRSVRAAAPAKARRAPPPQYEIVVIRLQQQAKD